MMGKGEKLLELAEIRSCRFVRRINRFTAEVLVGGKRRKASLNNTGRLEELLEPGRVVYCMPGGGRLPLRLFAVGESGSGSVIDTRLQAAAFEMAMSRGLLPRLSGYRVARRNVRMGRSVIDYELDGERKILLELKSAVLRRGGLASYPDCPTERGRRQVQDLIEWIRSGGAGMLFFVTSLRDVRGITLNAEADPELRDLVEKAARAGLRLGGMNISFRPSDSGILLEDPDIPVLL